jgi:hypothetical protein
MDSVATANKLDKEAEIAINANLKGASSPKEAGKL